MFCDIHFHTVFGFKNHRALHDWEALLIAPKSRAMKSLDLPTGCLVTGTRFNQIIVCCILGAFVSNAAHYFLS